LTYPLTFTTLLLGGVLYLGATYDVLKAGELRLKFCPYKDDPEFANALAKTRQAMIAARMCFMCFVIVILIKILCWRTIRPLWKLSHIPRAACYNILEYFCARLIFANIAI